MKNTMKLIGIIAIAAIIVMGISCKPRESGAASANGSSAATTVAGGNTIDRLLDEMEKLADDYVLVIQRMIDGDFTALGDLEGYAQQIQDWALMWEDISEDDLSPEQAARYWALSEKLTEALDF